MLRKGFILLVGVTEAPIGSNFNVHKNTLSASYTAVASHSKILV